MDYKKDREKVTAIVPAYNEAERIGAVLAVLTSYGFKGVIVVDDGSTDNTKDVVSRYDVRYLKIEENSGKGKAMDYAVSKAQTSFIFFCDADLKNLTHEIIDETISPVIDGDVEMFIGMISRGMYAMTRIVIFIPLLGGMRALTKNLWEKLPNWYKNKFRIESGLNFYSKYYGKGLGYKIFPGLSQVIKERKYGFWNGTKKRFMMIGDIIYAGMKAEAIEIPNEVGRKRALYARVVGGIASTIVGALVMFAAYTGPLTFIRDVFSKELVEDPTAVFVHFLIRNAARVSVQALMLIGLLVVVLNLVTTILRIKKLKELSHVKSVARRKVKA